MSKQGFRYDVGSRVARHLLDALLATVRFEVEGDEGLMQYRRAQRPVIFILWHGRLLPLTYFHRNQGIVSLISRSADGEYIARIVEQWGYSTVRGSSSRGATAALRELVRHGRAGRSLAITPDGPRGPRQKLQPGALVAAQLTGAPLIPVAGGTDRAWWFGSWDRFLVPRPFAHIRVAYGPPILVPRDADAEALAAMGNHVEEALNTLMQRVDGNAPDD